MIKIDLKNSLYPHRHFTEHLVSTFRKSPWESDLNHESSSLLIWWLKNYTEYSLQPSTHKKPKKSKERSKLSPPTILAREDRNNEEKDRANYPIDTWSPGYCCHVDRTWRRWTSPVGRQQRSQVDAQDGEETESTPERQTSRKIGGGWRKPNAHKKVWGANKNWNGNHAAFMSHPKILNFGMWLKFTKFKNFFLNRL
jgi:hypothetical protein